ncbi:MAG: class I SAM-dependent methyltransferase, partial [Marinibacterium sp.]
MTRTPPRKSPAELAEYYSALLRSHGDSAVGAGWPNAADRRTRFDVMASLAGPDLARASLCDMACGTGEFLAHLRDRGQVPAGYVGIDICDDAITRARAKFPDAEFVCRDVLTGDGPVPQEPVDYTVINGLFTVRADLDEDAMWAFMQAIVARLWAQTRRGLAFNVMSAVVDWTRKDLFHVSMDRLAAWLFPLAGRRVIFRNDYDLYEYTVYLYRDPVADRDRQGR